MDSFNFAIASFAVVVALGVTDIANSVHRLLTSRVPVQWSILPLAAAALIGLILSSVWFQLWLLRGVAEVLNFWTLTSLMTQALFVYLAAAASLPDHPELDSDLGAYYWRRRRQIWLPMTLFAASMLAHTVYFGSILPNFPIAFWDWAWRVVPLPVYALLAFSRSGWVHYAGLAILLALLIQRTTDWSL